MLLDGKALPLQVLERVNLLGQLFDRHPQVRLAYLFWLCSQREDDASK